MSKRPMLRHKDDDDDDHEDKSASKKARITKSFFPLCKTVGQICGALNVHNQFRICESLTILDFKNRKLGEGFSKYEVRRIRDCERLYIPPVEGDGDPTKPSATLMGYGGVPGLVSALKHNTTVTTLNLSGNDIKFRGAVALWKLLRHNKTLTALDISYNCVGNSINDDATMVSMDGLDDALASNTTLTDLNMAFNSISGGGFRKLRDGLRKNNTLKRLNLSRNMHCGPNGACDICLGLINNTGLTELDMSECLLYDEGASAFEALIRFNPTITSLKLFKNNCIMGETLRAKLLSVATYRNRMFARWQKTAALILGSHTAIYPDAAPCDLDVFPLEIIHMIFRWVLKDIRPLRIE